MPTTMTPEPRLLPWPTGVPEPLSAPPLTDANSDGPKVIRWIEQNCVQGEGDHWGEPVRLAMFQKIFLCWLFEKKRNASGRYRYRRALLQVPKGNSKTSMAAWIGAYQLAHQRSPVIPVAAASYDQAEILFGDLRTTVTESPTLSQVMIPFESEVQVKSGPGRAYKVAAIAGTNDGQRPSTFLADEIHEWSVGNRERVHLVLSNGCTKRDGSLVLNTTTPGWDMDTLAGKMHSYGLAVNSGEITDDEFLFVWWGCPGDRYDLADEKGLLAAIRDANPAADLFLNTADVAARYHQIPLHEFLRYHLGIWTRTAQAWLPAGVWDACRGAECGDRRRRRCRSGFRRVLQRGLHRAGRGDLRRAPAYPRGRLLGEAGAGGRRLDGAHRRRRGDHPAGLPTLQRARNLLRSIRLPAQHADPRRGRFANRGLSAEQPADDPGHPAVLRTRRQPGAQPRR